MECSPYRYEPRHSLYASSGDSSSSSSNQSGPLSSEGRLQKLLWELVATERSYVSDLAALESTYLLPLRASGLLHPPILAARLVSAAADIRRFQSSFLEELEELTGGPATGESKDAPESLFPTPGQLRVRLTRNCHG